MSEITEQELGGEIMHCCQFTSVCARAQAITAVLDRCGEEFYTAMLGKMAIKDAISLTRWLSSK